MHKPRASAERRHLDDLATAREQSQAVSVGISRGGVAARPEARNHGVNMRLVIGLLAFAGVVEFGLVMLLRATGLFPSGVWPT